MDDQVVTVITPTGAPHLARTAHELAVRVSEQLAALPPDALCHLLRMGAEIAGTRDQYERFRRRLGVK